MPFYQKIILKNYGLNPKVQLAIARRQTLHICAGKGKKSFVTS